MLFKKQYYFACQLSKAKKFFLTMKSYTFVIIITIHLK